MALPKKKVYIRTFGCQMNVADSEQMAQLLAHEYELTEPGRGGGPVPHQHLRHPPQGRGKG